jgi:hypothetical protein
MSVSGIWLNIQEYCSCFYFEEGGGAGVGVNGAGEAELSDRARVAFWVAGSAVNVVLECVACVTIALENGKGFWRFACFGGMLFAQVMVDG